jgi:integral membrane protein (TIGR01906 family)
VSADDSNEPKDLLSQRLSSQPGSEDETAAHYARSGPAGDSGSHGTDRTSTFDADTQDTTRAYGDSAGTYSGSADSAGTDADVPGGADYTSDVDHTPGSVHAGGTADPDATAEFDPITQSPDAPTAAYPASQSGRPDMFSDEEWALLNDGGSASGGAGAGAAGAAGAGAAGAAAASGAGSSGKLTRKERREQKRAAKIEADRQETRAAEQSLASRGVVVPERKRTILDVIGAVWITIAFPFVALALAVRAVASGWFLTWTYSWRPGFPDDQYGFTDADRLHYGSYTVDYLFNLATERYLSDVVLPDGTPVFTAGEISHMADVKNLIGILTLVAVIGAIGIVVFGLYKCRAGGSGMRGSLRAGPILTIVLFGVLAVLAIVGWEQFFTGFHNVFFADGTWTFYMNDSLIRLFPPQFWIDAGIAVAVIVLALCVFAFILSFVGRRRRTAV